MSVNSKIKYRPASELLGNIIEIYGMNLEGLAIKVGMPPQNLAAYITGNHKDEIRYHTLKDRIKKSFGFPNDVFLQGKNGRDLMEKLARESGMRAEPKKAASQPAAAPAPEAPAFAASTGSTAEKYGRDILAILGSMEKDLTSETAGLREKVAALEAEVADRDSKISDLTSGSEARDARILELETEVEALKSTGSDDGLSEEAKKAIAGIRSANSLALNLINNIIDQFNKSEG